MKELEERYEIRLSKKFKLFLMQVSRTNKIPISRIFRLAVSNYFASREGKLINKELKKFAINLYNEEINYLKVSLFEEDKKRSDFVFKFKKALFRAIEAEDNNRIDDVAYTGLSHHDKVTKKKIEEIIKKYLPRRILTYKKKLLKDQRKAVYKPKLSSPEIKLVKSKIEAIDCEMIPIIEDGKVIDRISRREHDRRK